MFGDQLIKGNKLFNNANTKNFPVKKNNFIQAMLSVNDMFALASSSVATLFFKDVKDWLDEKNIRYVPSVKFDGKSGSDFRFYFVVAKYKKHLERILQVINQPIKSNVEQLLFSWSNTKDVRFDNSELSAIINDMNQKLSAAIKQSLEIYNVTPIA